MVSLTGSDRINLLTSHRSLPIVLSHSAAAIAQASARLSAYWRQLAVYQPLLASSFPCIALTANERQRGGLTGGEEQQQQHLTQHMPHPQNCIDWEPAHMLNPINLCLATASGAEPAQLCRQRVQIMRHSPFATLPK